jgi:hypothetical protein
MASNPPPPLPQASHVNPVETRLAKQEPLPPHVPVEQYPRSSKHFTAAELGKIWGLSAMTIRRLFEDEPGVLRIEIPSRREGRKLVQSLFTMRIPEDVAQRVHDRLSAKTGMDSGFLEP